MAFEGGTFTEWLNHLNGIQVSKQYLKFTDQDGRNFHNPRRGVFTYRNPDLGEVELDVNGKVEESTLTQSFTRWKAFLYFRYLLAAKKNGFEADEFVDAWAEMADDDED